MTADDFMRLADDGCPHCPEEIRTVTVGGRAAPVPPGPIVITVREVYGGQIEPPRRRPVHVCYGPYCNVCDPKHTKPLSWSKLWRCYQCKKYHCTKCRENNPVPGEPSYCRECKPNAKGKP